MSLSRAAKARCALAGPRVSESTKYVTTSLAVGTGSTAAMGRFAILMICTAKRTMKRISACRYAGVDGQYCTVCCTAVHLFVKVSCTWLCMHYYVKTYRK